MHRKRIQSLTLFLYLLFPIFPVSAQSQSIQGNIKDSNKGPVGGAIVKAIDPLGAVISYAISNPLGEVSISFKHADLLIISHLNYHSDTLLISKLRDPFTIILRPKDMLIDEVVIAERRLPYQNRGDTTTFHADAFREGGEKTLEQLLKKMPGVEIGENGTISFRGKAVSKVLLESDNLFGNRYALGTQSMDPRYVEDLQFIDHYQEEELKNGVVHSQALALNLTLKDEAKLSMFGNAELGGGPKERYVGRLNAFALVDKYKSALFSNLDNVSYQEFDLYDYLLSGEDFESEAYNRSLSGFLLSSPMPLEGISFGRRAFSRNAYSSSHHVLRGRSFKNQFRLLLSQVSHSGQADQTVGYLGLPQSVWMQNKEGIRHKGISLFNEFSWRLGTKAKLNLQTQFSNRYDLSNQRQEIEAPNQFSSFLYQTNAKHVSFKNQVSFLKKLNSHSLLSIEYLSLYAYMQEGALHENILAPQGLAGFGSLLNQGLTQKMQDHVWETKLQVNKGKGLSSITLGFLRRQDFLRNLQGLSRDTLFSSSSFSNHLHQPYLQLKKSFVNNAWKASLSLKQSLISEEADFSDRLYLHEIKSSLSYRARANHRIGLTLLHNSRLRPPIYNSQFSYFSSANSQVQHLVNFRKQHTGLAGLTFFHSNPAKLQEIQGNVFYSLRQTPLRSLNIQGANNRSTYEQLVYLPSLQTRVAIDQYVKSLQSNLSLSASFFSTKHGMRYQHFEQFKSRRWEFSGKVSSKQMGFFSLHLGSAILLQEQVAIVQDAPSHQQISYFKLHGGLSLHFLSAKQIRMHIASQAYSDLQRFSLNRNHFLDLSLDWQVNERWTLSFSCKNILNTQMYNNLYLNPIESREVYSWVQPRYAYVVIGRKFG